MSETVIVPDGTNVGADAQTQNNDLIPRTEAQKAFMARDAEKARARELEEKLAKYEADAETRRQAEMTELDKLREENQKFKLKADRADLLQQTIENQVNSIMETIPENKRRLILDTLSPEQKLDYINKNRDLLSADVVPTTPKTFGGSPASGKPDLKGLTDVERQFCLKHRIPEEKYAAFKK